MFRIAIVEDDRSSSEMIRNYLLRYGEERKIGFYIDVFEDGDAIVDRYPADYDLLLMDIELPLLNGMDAAAEIRSMDSDVSIIFITNSPQYALQGYRVRAMDYLLKPIQYPVFEETMSEALERLKKREDRSIVIQVKGGKKKLSVQKIRYIEVQDHALTYHTTDGDFGAKGTIRDAVEELQDAGFFHCNKGYLINLAYVDGISGQDIRIGSDVIPVGRTRKKAFMDAMNEYMNRR